MIRMRTTALKKGRTKSSKIFLREKKIRKSEIRNFFLFYKNFIM